MCFDKQFTDIESSSFIKEKCWQLKGEQNFMLVISKKNTKKNG